MKKLILLLIGCVIWANTIAQKDLDDVYKQAINYYFNPLLAVDQEINKIYQGGMMSKDGKMIKDTIIIQKEAHLPEELPLSFNNHVIKYMSEEEADHFLKYPLMTISAVKQQGDTYSLMIRTFSAGEKHRITREHRIYKFIPDPQSGKFVLQQPVITYTKTKT